MGFKQRLRAITGKDITHFTSAMLVGFLISFGAVLIRLLTGSSLFSAIFWEAWQILDQAKFMRPRHQLVLLVLLTVTIVLPVLAYRFRQHPKAKLIRLSALCLLTYALCETAQYQLMNALFYEDVFNTVPFMLGCAILTSSLVLALADAKLIDEIITPLLNSSTKSFRGVVRKEKIPAMAQLPTFIILGLFLMVPNLAPLAGLLPYPPELDRSEFGGSLGVYETDEINVELQIPQNTFDVMADYEQEMDWKMRFYLPDLVSKGVTNATIPVAFFFHGFLEYEPDQFLDMVQSLTSRGTICVYIHYPSVFVLPEDVEIVENQGGENWPQMGYRFQTIIPAMQRAHSILSGQTEAEVLTSIDESIGSNTPSFDHLWLGGMSLGGGMMTTIASFASAQSWGDSTFIVDAEVPAVHSTIPEYFGDLSQLPDHTIINVVNADEDNVVPRCAGKWLFERFATRDGAGMLDENQTHYILVNSDRRGFPRLVATHYLSASAVRDQLADHSVFKRFDAMGAYIFATANSDQNTAATALPYFTDPAVIADLGDWSDGIPVKMADVSSDPLGIRAGQPELSCV